MTSYPSIAETGGENGIIWEDGAGGYITVTIIKPDHTDTHKLHVLAFDGSSPPAYSSGGGGKEVNVVDTMANVIALLAPVFPATTTITPGQLYQTTGGGVGVQPVPVAWPGGLTVNGSSSGAQLDSAAQLSYSGHGADFSRWQFHLYGPSASFWGNPERIVTALGGDASSQFAQYLCLQRTGPGLAGHGVGMNSMVCSHSGAVLVVPIYLLTSTSKRLRRRLGIA